MPSLTSHPPHRSTLFPYTTLFRSGFETGDPSGSEPGILPTFGLSLPLPLFNRNRGPIAQLEAERQRARAELRSEEHTSELQSQFHLVCRLLLEKKKQREQCYDARS